MGQRFDDEVNNRRKILNSLSSTEERLLRAFSSDFCHLDNQGGKITKLKPLDTQGYYYSGNGICTISSIDFRGRFNTKGSISDMFLSWGDIK